MRFILALFLFSFAAQLLSEEKSYIYTVDLNKLLRSTDFGKNITYLSNNERKILQEENEALEEELLNEEKM